MTQYVFVYNAKSGAMNALVDGMHKFFSPSTYQCNLCQITHGHLGEKSRWRQFRLEHGSSFRFLHIDEFESEFGGAYTFPIVLKQQGKDLSVLISTEEVNGCRSQEELIELVESRIGENR